MAGLDLLLKIRAGSSRIPPVTPGQQRQSPQRCSTPDQTVLRC
jgi:hypothetical protein